MNKTIRPLSAILFLLFFSGPVLSVNLENWRAPWFKIAASQNELYSSPSGLFFDDVTFTGPLFQSLAPDTTLKTVNHWLVEPAFSVALSNEPYLSGKKVKLHVDALSDFTYGPLLVRTVLDVDSDYKKDPTFIWKDDRIAAGLIEEAYLQLTGKPGFIRFGRLKRNWGPFPDHSLLLSSNPFSYDALELQLATPFLEFRHLFAAFPDKYSYVDTKLPKSSPQIDRFFAAHSLNFILGKFGSIGVSETALFSRKNGFPDFQYVNPVSIYTVSNTNTEGDANLMLGFQWKLHPLTPKIAFKGQLVFDDIQVDNEDAGDQEPSHWAGDFALDWTDPLPLAIRHGLTIEYRYLSKWMYTVSNSNTTKGERYTYAGKSLGMQNIDGDHFSAEFTFSGRDYWSNLIGFSVERQDTGTINTAWHPSTDTTNVIGLGYRDEPSLKDRSNLTTTLNIYLQSRIYFRDFTSLSLLFDNQFIKEKSGSNTFDYDPKITLIFDGHISKGVVRFKDTPRSKR